MGCRVNGDDDDFLLFPIKFEPYTSIFLKPKISVRLVTSAMNWQIRDRGSIPRKDKIIFLL